MLSREQLRELAYEASPFTLFLVPALRDFLDDPEKEFKVRYDPATDVVTLDDNRSTGA